MVRSVGMAFVQVRAPFVVNAFDLTVYVIHRIRPTRSVKGDPGQWNLRWNHNSEWKFYNVSLSILPYPNTEDGFRPDVSPGTYILSVVAHDFSFDQVGIWLL